MRAERNLNDFLKNRHALLEIKKTAKPERIKINPPIGGFIYEGIKGSHNK